MVDSLAQFALAALLILPLFSVGYLNNWGSIDSTFIAHARFLVEHWPHPGWQPLWYGGTRFDYVYPPALLYGTAVLAMVFGVSLAQAYHLYTAILYSVGIAGVGFFVRYLSGSRVSGWIAAVATALLLWQQQRIPEMTRLLEMALRSYHQDPWPLPQVMRQALRLAIGVGSVDKAAGERLLTQLETPFALSMLEHRRLRDALTLAESVGFERYCRGLLAAWEPHFPWDEDALRRRVRCYERTGDARLDTARPSSTAFCVPSPCRSARTLRVGNAGRTPPPPLRSFD